MDKLELLKFIIPRRKDSLESLDPSFEATKGIPNQYVDQDNLPVFSHAGDNVEIIIGDKDVQSDSLTKLLDQTLNPKFG